VAWALHTFFAPVHPGLATLATLAAWLWLGYAAVFAVAISHLLGVLPLLRDPPFAGAIGLDQRRAEALFRIQNFQDVWQVGLMLFGLHLALIGYLAFRSGCVPRALGVLVAVAGAGYLVDSFGWILLADHTVRIAAFTFLGEALLMIWLLVKGRLVTP
jgi:hypothetical protein